jgi:lipopolysaccharide export LptBFGC system permease protein LptF
MQVARQHAEVVSAAQQPARGRQRSRRQIERERARAGDRRRNEESARATSRLCASRLPRLPRTLSLARSDSVALRNSLRCTSTPANEPRSTLRTRVCFTSCRAVVSGSAANSGRSASAAPATTTPRQCGAAMATECGSGSLPGGGACGTMTAAMWRLHRYYLRELLINAGITLLVLFAIVVISMVARGIQRAQGGELLDAVVITIFFSLDALPHLLPISFLVATVLTFARSKQDREITAIRSAGISPRVPMMAAVLVGIFLSIAGSLCMHYVLPEVHFRKYRVIAEAVRNAIMSTGLAGSADRISIPGTGVTLTYGARQGRGAEEVVLSDCWLYLSDDRQRDLVGSVGFVSTIVHVDRVTIPPPDDQSTALVIELDSPRDPVTGYVAPSSRFDFPLHGLSEGRRRDERDEDIVSHQLLSEVLRGLHDRPDGAKYTLARRTCFAVLPLLLGPIGFCIALLGRDRGRSLPLLLSLVPLLVFYLGDVLGAKFVRTSGAYEFAWLPIVLLLGLGAPFCWRELRQ